MKYLEVLGNHFSMTKLEVAEALIRYIRSGSIDERKASKERPIDDQDHQIPIATQCLDKVRLEVFNPSSVVETALNANSIVENTANIIPIPGMAYVYRKAQRLSDGSGWLEKKNKSHHPWTYEMYHGITEGYLSEHRETSLICTKYYF